jgi:hypothetical protein
MERFRFRSEVIQCQVVVLVIAKGYSASSRRNGLLAVSPA